MSEVQHFEDEVCLRVKKWRWLGHVQNTITSADALESTVAPKSSTGSHIVVFRMLPSWSYAVDVSKQNKENVVAGMANLSIADDGGSRTLTNSSNKPNGE